MSDSSELGKLKAENAWLNQCLQDELTNRPLLLKLEKDKYIMFGLLVGYIFGALTIYTLHVV